MRGATIMIEAKRASVRAVAVLVLFLTTGCGHMSTPHMSWPWHHKPPAAPQEVQELTMTAGEGVGGTTAIKQYWKRNTLLVDLQGVSGTGSIVMKPRERTTWPVRIAFRVMPGTIGILEVQGDQRMLLPITSQGAKPIDLELIPGVYTAKTPQLKVKWEPATPPAG